MQGLFAADGLGGAQNAKGPAYTVMQVLEAFLDQELPRLTLVVDHGRDHFAHLFDKVELAAAERDLVANLVEVSHRLRAFAVEAANGEPHLLQAAEGLVDLLCQDQGWQMEHDANTHAGTNIGGASG